MKTYCLSCRKHTDKVIREKSRYANFLAAKSRFLKENSNKKVVGIIFILNYLYTKHYKTR